MISWNGVFDIDIKGLTVNYHMSKTKNNTLVENEATEGKLNGGVTIVDNESISPEIKDILGAIKNAFVCPAKKEKESETDTNG